MKAISNMIKLDFLSIQPYVTIKNSLFFLVIALFNAYNFKNPMIIFYIIPIFFMFYVSYPFLVGEEGGIDVLYKMFGMREKTVVIARYLFSYLVHVCAVAVSAILYFALHAVLFSHRVLEMDMLFFNMASAFLFTSFISNVQLPIYFKLGYKSAKPLLMISYLLLAALLIGGKSLLPKAGMQLQVHPIYAMVLFALVYCAILFFSIFFSLKAYQKKDV